MLMAFTTLMTAGGTYEASVPLRLFSVGTFVYSLIFGLSSSYALASNRFKSLQGDYMSLALIV